MIAATPNEASMINTSMESEKKPVVHACENMHKINELMDSMRTIHSSARRTTSEYLMFCLIGFGSIERRDALLNAVTWTLQPILTYCAFVKEIASQEFEAIVVTKKQVDMNAVEEWLALFNMSVCCVEFEQYMQPAMVTCISRIHHLGRHWYGSFKTKQSARVRRDFYKEYMKQQLAKEHQRVLEVTGMTLTPRNMLALHGRLASLQTYVSYLERETESMRTARDRAGPPSETDVVIAHPQPAYLESPDTPPVSAELDNMPHSPRTSPPSPPPPPPPPPSSLPSTPEYRNSSATPPLVRVVGVPFVLRPGLRPGMTVYVVG
jgi:hypothetical protein